MDRSGKQTNKQTNINNQTKNKSTVYLTRPSLSCGDPRGIRHDMVSTRVQGMRRVMVVVVVI